MRAKSVSIHTVAAKARVSVATVSNVITGKPSVNAGLAARVRAAADELGYAADPHASRLRSGKHALAGVVVPDLRNPMFGAFVSTLETKARADGFDLLVVSSANDPTEEAERLKAIRSWRPAGLIVIPCDGALRQRLPRGLSVPIVVADRIPDDPSFDLIAVNNHDAAAAVTAHLSGQGRRSCLVAGSSLSISNVRERWEGVGSACGAMAVTMLECGVEPAHVRRRLVDELSGRRQPDALFTLDHITTLEAYQVLAELKPAARIALASFDETEWMRLVTPPLTAIRQPVEDMAHAAWSLLMRRIDGDMAAPETRRLTCAVTIRGSTLRTTSTPANKAA